MPRSSPSSKDSNKPRQELKKRRVIPKSTHLCYPYYLSRDILFDLQVRFRDSRDVLRVYVFFSKTIFLFLYEKQKC